MISIKGLRIPSLEVRRDTEKGTLNVTGYYELVSENDIVLAKQSFNDYSGTKLALSSDSQSLLNQFVASIKSDAEKALGLA
jgi:hypothetical protein